MSPSNGLRGFFPGPVCRFWMALVGLGACAWARSPVSVFFGWGDFLPQHWTPPFPPKECRMRASRASGWRWWRRRWTFDVTSMLLYVVSQQWRASRDRHSRGTRMGPGGLPSLRRGRFRSRPSSSSAAEASRAQPAGGGPTAMVHWPLCRARTSTDTEGFPVGGDHVPDTQQEASPEEEVGTTGAASAHKIVPERLFSQEWSANGLCAGPLHRPAWMLSGRRTTGWISSESSAI